MELLYLLGSTLRALGISLLLSLHFLWRGLFFSIKTTSSGDEEFHNNGDEDSMILYEGTVWHERRQPVVHSFQYTVRYALINLNKSPPWILPIISKNHMNATQVQAIAGTNGPVYLLTMPPSVGYEQNPLSVYYCYDAEGPTRFLRKCIAEVTNTPWGERVSFVFNPNADLVAKPLHVSPFMDMLGNWKMHASLPGRSLSLTLLVQHPEYGNYFTATLQAKKVEKLIANPEIFMWLVPHKVAFRIYWQALQLWWKGVPFVSHPKYANGKAYRDQALKRDSQLLSAQKGDNVSFQGLPELRVQDLPSFLHPSDPYKSVLRIVLDQFTPISQATWVLGNSFHELETTEIKSMDSLIPIRTVGPLIPSAFLDGNDLQATDVGVNLWKTVDCMDWLNTKGRSTVIYVSFGSLAVLSKGQIQEIALGLKDCGHPFLWVIRPADKKDEDKSSQLDLPEDFAEETVDRGLIVAWCTQTAVLCHPSVGLFITHCGWNSTLESLSTGVPVLALPQWSDQTTNSKYVEDKWKTGIRLTTTEDGLLARKELEKSIKKIMEGEAGVEVRKNALRWKKSAREAMMNGGSSNKCIEDFVEELSVTALSRPLHMFKN